MRSLRVRTLGAVLALLALAILGLHEGEHYVHGEQPDSCEFAFVADGFAPPPVTLAVPLPSPCATAWPLREIRAAIDAVYQPRSSRGPPASTRV